MLNNTERIIEAICDADGGPSWWEVFSSKEEAYKTISAALRESPDDGEVAMLLVMVEPDAESFEYQTPEQTYMDILRQLREDL